MFISLFTLWIVRVPLAYFLSQHTSLGVDGIWWAIPMTWCFGTLGSYIYYKMGNWQKKGVVEPVVVTDTTD
jgi:Na+-driven multidrug efflux pump